LVNVFCTVWAFAFVQIYDEITPGNAILPPTPQVSLLDRKNPELLILVTSFLKKLSCYSVNKEEMKVLNVADKLTHLLTTDNPGGYQLIRATD